MIWLAVLAAPALLVLGMILFNVSVWPQGRPDGRWAGRVSLLIPARNEAANIALCLRAALAGTRRPDEILVYDDGSVDGTAGIVAGFAAGDGRVRLLQGGELPPGWVGKPYACHRLAEAATGNVLVFLDADASLLPTGLARLASLFEDMRADAVTAGLRQQFGSWSERLVIPLLHLTYLAWLPLPLVWRTRDPRLLVANGQLFAVSRDAYRRAGGWAAVRAEVVDDMAFGRALKRAGARLVFADGFRMASCRMYRSAGEVVRGFSKNLYPGIGGTPGALAGVVGLYAWVFCLPYAGLVVAAVLVLPEVFRAALLGVMANAALRVVLALRYRQPPEGILLHPAGVLVLLGIALNSLRWHRRGAVAWRGRSYASGG